MGNAVEATPSRTRFQVSGTFVARAAVALAFIGSIAYIAYVAVMVRDSNQIPMLSTGFVVLGLAFGVVALWCLRSMWRAASRARGGRALALAVIGGLSALAAIGCFTLTALFTLVWTS